MKTLLLLLACLTLNAQADELSRDDILGTAAVLTTFAIDYRQTLDIKNHPGMYETNPILGKNPTDRQVKQYFVGASLVTLAAVYLMPAEYRKYFIGGALVMQIYTVGNNKRLGLRATF